MKRGKEAGNTAAFFDVDGTITRTTIAHYYFAYRLQHLSQLRKRLWLALYAPKGLFYIMLDKFSRTRFVTSFYRQYRGVDVEEFHRWNTEHFERFTKDRIFPEARQAIEEHRKQGDRIVFVTGGLKPRVKALAEYFEVDDLLAVELEKQDGKYTGNIEGVPLVDGEKAVRVKRYAEENGIDLAHSTAYGDSRSDLPVLETVGHPRVVGPELKCVARERGWEEAGW